MTAQTGTTITIEDATLIFRNFAGEESQFNNKGDRNFAVILPPELAETLLADGWNVKSSPARDEGDEDTLFLPVAVNFKNRPPNIKVITSAGPTKIGEDMAETLDYAEIKKADLIVRAYAWAVGDKTGVKAYLKSLFVTIEEDELERKYAQMEE